MKDGKADYEEILIKISTETWQIAETQISMHVQT